MHIGLICFLNLFSGHFHDHFRDSETQVRVRRVHKNYNSKTCLLVSEQSSVIWVHVAAVAIHEPVCKGMDVDAKTIKITRVNAFYCVLGKHVIYSFSLKKSLTAVCDTFVQKEAGHFAQVFSVGVESATCTVK